MTFQQYYGLTVLFVINTINFLDRLSIAAVITEITAYYTFDPFEAGALSSCFLMGYMLTAPIFGHFGDKYTRKWIIVGGILFWSIAAFSASLITVQYRLLFFLSRVLVGVGEASYSTIAPTIIADLFEPDKRKMALSIFYFAIPIGSGLGFLVGTIALKLGDWRWIFWITPFIGLVATLFLAFLDEPVRGQTEGVVSGNDDSNVIQNLKYLYGIKSYVWATLGFTCCLYATGALSWWGVNFVVVAHGKDYEQTATMVFGGIVCAAGIVGVTIGSTAAQYYRKFSGRSDPLVCSFGILVAIPFTLFGLTLIRFNTTLSWILLFVAVTALSTNWAVISDMVLSVTLPTKRAFATAIQILVSHLLGDAISPVITGYIKHILQPIFEDEFTAFLYALLTTLILLIVGVSAFVFSAKFYVHDVDKNQALLEKESEQAERPRDNFTEFSNLA